MAFISCDQLIGSADDITPTDDKTNTGDLLKYLLLFAVGAAGGYMVAALIRRKK